jgi:hypothetical protein
MADQSVTEVIYRWHQIMFRLDEMDETVAAGVTEDEAGNFDAEGADLRREIGEIERRLGVARVARLRASHELDRAYARQIRELEEEKGRA